MQYALSYFTEISKYIIIGIVSAYTLLGFGMLFAGAGKARKIMGICQDFMIFAVQAVEFIHMIVVSGDQDYLFLYLCSQVMLLAILGLVHLVYEVENQILLNNMCMLLGFGFCMIARLGFPKAVRQLVIVGLSFAISIFIPALLKKLHFWRKLTWFYAVVGVSALSVVLLLGEVSGGSKISFTIADSITFQPSEFVKILFLFFLAGALWEEHHFWNVALTAVVAGIHVIILVISVDLGSALIFFVTYVLIVFVVTRNYLYLLLGAAGGSGAAVLAYQFFNHVRVRVLAWQDPWSYIDREGYQITQSLFAIGSGNWFGMGLMHGNPKAIPRVDRDFIFSSVCEEMGVITGICLALICLISFLAMSEIAVKVQDSFYQLIVYGIAVEYLFQIILTIGGGIKFIPMTGVTLPFVSYGGSSAMTTMFMYFIVQGIYLMMLQQEGGKSDDGRVRTASKKGPKRTRKVPKESSAKESRKR